MGSEPWAGCRVGRAVTVCRGAVLLRPMPASGCQHRWAGGRHPGSLQAPRSLGPRLGLSGEGAGGAQPAAVTSPAPPRYCPKCKQHREASKQLLLWRLPNVLIIQLKRFSFRSFIWRDKINDMVDFPVR